MTQPYVPPQPAAQPPKKKNKKWLYIGIGVAVFVVIGVAASSGDSGETPASDARPAQSAPKDAGQDEKPQEEPQEEQVKTAAEKFKEYVAKHGTPEAKAAVHHVRSVQGADDISNLLDTAEIHTDFRGDMFSDDAGKAKLLATEFAEWQASRGKDSKNGLVTVYNANGEVLSNGKF